MRDFSEDLAGSGTAEFEAWMIENPHGYYVNLTSARRGLLHRGGCWHMSYGPGEANLVSHRKWTSAERRELEERALREQVKITLCKSCGV